MLLQVASQETLVRDILTAFQQATFFLGKVLYVQWGNVRRPLPEVMDTFLQQLTVQQGAGAMFAQCDDAVNLSRSFLPCKQANYTQERLQASLRVLYLRIGLLHMRQVPGRSLPI